MRRKCLSLLCLVLVALGSARAQQEETYTWQNFVDEISDDEYAEEQGWAESMEELAILSAHPLDINTATREQLDEIPFLDEGQIEEIHAYVFRHRGMRSLSELMAIPSIDYRTRRFLSLFLRADPAVFERKDTLNLKTLLRHSQHELLTRLDVPLYYRAGYSYPPRAGGYAGLPLYHRIRYQASSLNHLSLGLSAEKDQGEPFHRNRGWDHYGIYLMVRNMGCLRTAVLGDYKLGFGEGLVVNTGFSAGKGSLMNRPSQGIRAHRGTDEVNFLRGGAATFKVKQLDISAWASHRQLDATLGRDGTVTTLLTSGLHRTASELNRKGNLGSTVAGANLTWRDRGFHLGLTGYFQRYSKPLSPGSAPYRRIYPRGRKFGVTGINYGYTHLWFSLSGETAYSMGQQGRGGIATLNRAIWKISPQCTLSGSFRFYSYKFSSFYASALSENSRVQNESAATVRLDANPADRLFLTLYADFFYNPWPRYTLTHSSRGQEVTANASYALGRANSFSLRYQLKRKERSNQMQLHNRLRVGYTRQQGAHWQLQSYLHLHAVDTSRGLGWALSQRAKGQWGRGGFSALLAYFHTPDYDTRLYHYEPLLTHMFRFPSLYGRGVRFAAAARYALWQGRLVLEALYNLTRYTDRKSQSSGMQEIRSPWKQDVSVQLRLVI
ncbi:MAG: helix-hairpin-helix domain-containing protein [Bacteroidaceae bacterium]|nr:helix-hairpin-helix domain-containing protein [Bacteroidaceae bacterium]